MNDVTIGAGVDGTSAVAVAAEGGDGRQGTGMYEVYSRSGYHIVPYVSRNPDPSNAHLGPEACARDVSHPLFQVPISDCCTWSQWLERWKSHDVVWVWERIGLLHAGFFARPANLNQEIERIILYLSIADGWRRRQ